MLGLITDSFQNLPIGQSLLHQETYGRVLRWSSMMFLGSLLMALPVMISLRVRLGFLSSSA